MTTPALIKRADLKRIADIAKQKGVRVEIEINGRIIRVSPNIPEIHNGEAIDPSPEYFSSLAEWEAWRDRERAREAKRHS